jgi:hypothetical protein
MQYLTGHPPYMRSEAGGDIFLLFSSQTATEAYPASYPIIMEAILEARGA